MSEEFYDRDKDEVPRGLMNCTRPYEARSPGPGASTSKHIGDIELAWGPTESGNRAWRKRNMSPAIRGLVRLCGAVLRRLVAGRAFLFLRGLRY